MRIVRDLVRQHQGCPCLASASWLSAHLPSFCTDDTGRQGCPVSPRFTGLKAGVLSQCISVHKVGRKPEMRNGLAAVFGRAARPRRPGRIDRPCHERQHFDRQSTGTPRANHFLLDVSQVFLLMWMHGAVGVPAHPNRKANFRQRQPRPEHPRHDSVAAALCLPLATIKVAFGLGHFFR